MSRTSLPEKKLDKALERVDRAQDRVQQRYPGDGGTRQPVHTVYGGAHLFNADTAHKLGELALRALDTYAPDAHDVRRGDRPARRPRRQGLRARARQAAAARPVEDFRIDFEDGYGNRPDAEEDGHAVAAAQRGRARRRSAGTLPPFIGIRIKPLSRRARARAALRTLDLFLTDAARRDGGQAARPTSS